MYNPLIPFLNMKDINTKMSSSEWTWNKRWACR